jgi:hypothetical protein
MIDDPVATYLGNSQGSPKWLMNPKVLVESIALRATFEASRKRPNAPSAEMRRQENTARRIGPGRHSGSLGFRFKSKC